jgi:hypothetical protein
MLAATARQLATHSDSAPLAVARISALRYIGQSEKDDLNQKGGPGRARRGYNFQTLSGSEQTGQHDQYAYSNAG